MTATSRFPRITPGEPLRSECRHFLECIDSGQEPSTGGHEAVSVIRVLEAMQRSLQHRGREEPIVP